VSGNDSGGATVVVGGECVEESVWGVGVDISSVKNFRSSVGVEKDPPSDSCAGSVIGIPEESPFGTDDSSSIFCDSLTADFSTLIVSFVAGGDCAGITGASVVSRGGFRPLPSLLLGRGGGAVDVAFFVEGWEGGGGKLLFPPALSLSPSPQLAALSPRAEAIPHSPLLLGGTGGFRPVS
jgi:hypothetical protein